MRPQIKKMQPLRASVACIAALLILIPALPRLIPFDLTILNHIHARATPTLTLLARTLSFIGSPRTLWPVTLAIAAVLWLRRHHHAATTLLITMAASGLLESLVKLAVRRHRPAIPWAYAHENTYSFPSGHATLAMALYGLILPCALRRPLRQRAALIALSLTMTLAIGLSRLYLGAHHPTDVLAGYLTGATCLLLTLQYRPPG